MAITQTIATLPAVLNDSATFYEDIAERNNSLVTTVLPSINAWALQANTTQTEINEKAAQIAAQAVDGGYSQNYINTNFVGVKNAQNITAVKTFTVSPIVPTPTTTGNIITMDNIIQKTAVGIGYGTGAGGTVTQLTSKSTSVTLNKPCGQIWTNNATLSAGATATFACYNNLVSIYDIVIVHTGDLLKYECVASVQLNDGGFNVRLTNRTANAYSENVLINFTVIKGVVV